MHADLGDAKTRPHRARQDLGADHGPFGLGVHHVEDPPIEELEGAVDVARRNAEEVAHEEVPRSGVDAAQAALGTVDAVADHDVVFRQRRQQRRDLADVELAVAVREEDVGLPARRETGLERAPYPRFCWWCTTRTWGSAAARPSAISAVRS
mgnify:CR=1 FL=1